MGMLDLLTQHEPSKKQRMYGLALQLLALMSQDETAMNEDGSYKKLDGTQPEIYVAPRVSPSP